LAYITQFQQACLGIYNLNTGYNERANLATKYPEKLKELQALFDDQA